MREGKNPLYNPELENDPTVKRLIGSRIRLLVNKPFIGNIITRLELIENNTWCTTAATDGRAVYWNREFINKLDDQELDFLFGHEVYHVVFDHLGRRNDRKPRLWNIANDFVINDLLVQEGVGRLITTVKPCYDIKYRGMFSEEVYQDLEKQMEQNPQMDLGQTLDHHLDGDGGDNGEDGSGPAGAGGCKDGKDGPPAYSDEMKKQIADEVKNAVMEAAQAAGAGNVPGAIKRMIDKLTEPKMNWRELIDVNIQSVFKRDFTFMRPSRRGWHCDAILPSMDNDETIDVVLALDMSGSIGTKQATDMFSEVKGIMEQYTDFRLRVFQFDTDVYNYAEFTPENMDELEDYEITGGGGTDFDCIFDYLKREDISPEKLIVFTDGYPFGSWGDDTYCDTLWVIHSHHDKTLEAPFGVTCHYESFEKNTKQKEAVPF